MISIHVKIIGLNHVGGALTRLEQALFHSMQEKNRRYHMKGDIRCPSWSVFQSNEKISKKIHQKNL